jgi:hypothetical protein
METMACGSSGCDRPETVEVVFVLGMHRSGTSALAGLLEVAGGLPFGPVSRSPSLDNAKGHFENYAVAALNDSVSGPWFAPAALPPTARFSAAVHDYLGRFGGAQFGIKDPRLLVALPAWLPHVAHAQMIGIFRHPSAVVRSLIERDKRLGWGLLDEVSAAELWLEQNRRLIALKEQFGFPLLYFGGHPDEFLRRVEPAFASLGFGFDTSMAREFFSPALVHHGAGQRPNGDAAVVFEHLMHLAELPLLNARMKRAGVPPSAPLPRHATVRVPVDMWRDQQLEIAEWRFSNERRHQQLVERDQTIMALRADLQRAATVAETKTRGFDNELAGATPIVETTTAYDR